jgi:hypothetical protein
VLSQPPRPALGGMSPSYASVLFFWSAQQIALYYVGHISGFDGIVDDAANDLHQERDAEMNRVAGF